MRLRGCNKERVECLLEPRDPATIFVWDFLAILLSLNDACVKTGSSRSVPKRIYLVWICGACFPLKCEHRLRGHIFELYRKNFRCGAREHFLSNRVFLSWNKLIDDLMSSDSFNSFKSRYDRWKKAILKMLKN